MAAAAAAADPLSPSSVSSAPLASSRRTISIDPAFDAAHSQFKEREARRRLPSDGYEWLDVRGTGTYQTDDGLHLVKSSAQRVARVLAAVAEQTAGP